MELDYDGKVTCGMHRVEETVRATIGSDPRTLLWDDEQSFEGTATFHVLAVATTSSSYRARFSTTMLEASHSYLSMDALRAHSARLTG
jgi:hypothetical protein